MAVLTQQRAEGAHWYHADGRPQHTVANADGDGVRSTTIKDARKMNLLPSVTSILSIFAKPQLEKWKMRQVANAAPTIPRGEGEPDERWADRVIDAAFVQVREAADLGSEIHGALELALTGELWNRALEPYVLPVLLWVAEKGLQVEALEKRIVCIDHGFAGTADFLFRFGQRGVGVIDYKTRKTKPGEKVTPYDGQAMQLAAYAAAYWGVDRLPDVLAANVYISTTEPGRFDVCKHDDLVGEWDAFTHACALWRYQKRYDPRRQDASAARVG